MRNQLHLVNESVGPGFTRDHLNVTDAGGKSAGDSGRGGGRMPALCNCATEPRSSALRCGQCEECRGWLFVAINNDISVLE